MDPCPADLSNLPFSPRHLMTQRATHGEGSSTDRQNESTAAQHVEWLGLPTGTAKKKNDEEQQQEQEDQVDEKLTGIQQKRYIK